jgi:hypothetical protein
MYIAELTADDKEQIINNEYKFIKTKIESEFVNFKLIQIPRIIYDLYNIIFLRDVNTKMEHFQCAIDSDISSSYEDIKQIIQTFNSKYNTNIILFNMNFIQLLSENNHIDDLLKLEISTDTYLTIFELLYDNIINTILEELKYKIKSRIFLHLTSIEKFENILNNRFKSILYQTLLIELGYIYDIKSDKYHLNTQNNLIILYRGYAGHNFNTTKNDQPHSNSFNTSILNGLVNRGIVDTAYDSDIDDFVFWVKDKDSNK